ncbi:MAG TPA: hypothetical protein VIJ80_00410, partial [Candidatus Cryosericum sp.]
LFSYYLPPARTIRSAMPSESEIAPPSGDKTCSAEMEEFLLRRGLTLVSLSCYRFSARASITGIALREA